MGAVRLFQNYTENLMDFVKNIIHKMDQYIDGFRNYIPRVISDSSYVEKVSPDDIDFWMFLSVESDDILRNKSTKTIFEIADYVRRKHHYLMLALHRSKADQYHLPKIFFDSLCDEIRNLREAQFKLTEETVQSAYMLDDLIGESIKSAGGIDHIGHHVMNKDDTIALLDQMFDELEKSTMYIQSLSNCSESSAKSCYMVKELLSILVKCYIAIYNVFIDT